MKSKWSVLFQQWFIKTISAWKQSFSPYFMKSQWGFRRLLWSPQFVVASWLLGIRTPSIMSDFRSSSLNCCIIIDTVTWYMYKCRQKDKHLPVLYLISICSFCFYDFKSVTLRTIGWLHSNHHLADLVCLRMISNSVCDFTACVSKSAYSLSLTIQKGVKLTQHLTKIYLLWYKKWFSNLRPNGIVLDSQWILALIQFIISACRLMMI